MADGTAIIGSRPADKGGVTDSRFGDLAIDGQWTQLEPGAFAYERRAADLGGIQVLRSAFNLGYKAEGELAPGIAVISIPGDRETQARWFGNRIGYDHIASSGRGYDITTSGPATFYSAILDREEISARFGPGATDSALFDAGAPALVNDDSEHAAALRIYVHRIVHDYAIARGETLAVQASVRHTLLPLLAIAFEQPRESNCPVAVTRRVAAVRISEAYVAENIDSNPSLLDLSKISGLRLRSLINAFRAVTGMSPMAYLKRQRLNAVRRALTDAEKENTRIIDVAANWGFWHMGHFTTDYRELFGETPSETLRRK